MPRDATSVWDIIGTIADSIAGIGAAGALILGFVVFKRQQDDSRKAQANEIAAGHGDMQQLEGESMWSIGVEYANYSKFPIYGLRCRIWNLGRRRSKFEWMTHSGQSISADTLKPGESRVDMVETILRTDEWKSAVMFTDSAGREWARFTDGALVGGVKDFLKLVVACEDYVDAWRVEDQQRIDAENEVTKKFEKRLAIGLWFHKLKRRVTGRPMPEQYEYLEYPEEPF
ncbi:hypothetical protein [Pseudonocardia sp. T1-2H]|uniref:hypothetical protein n=1 Tax=Pseudonocardia sp. T1-2H TaxID=3128899 RepID=UPI003101A340